MRKIIVLLDVDGVLIHALGYRASVKATVEYLAQQMGQLHINGTDEADMLAFEAQSIIFEWDSAAICVAALLIQVPELLDETLETTISKIANSGIRLTEPDYATIARQCPPAPTGVRPARATLGTLFPENGVFSELLGNTHSINAPITRIFQHYVLGHDQYGTTYQVEPLFETPSLLEQLDVPVLTSESRQRLYSTDSIYHAVYTARPSLPPSFVNNGSGYSPEAEIAQKLLEMHATPLMAYGRVQWLAQQQGVPSNTYVKPSPVQALAAIYSAVLYGTPDWEKRALELAINSAIPDELKASPWHIIVCEDSTGGIRGVREAATTLAEQHEVTVSAVGIATVPENIASLETVADYVAPDVNVGLAWALEW